MKITIVAFDIWGFNKKIVDFLISQGHEVTFLDSYSIHFKYKNFSQRVYNFFLKNLTGKNIKKNYLNNFLIEQITLLPEQDHILVVNPFQFKEHIIQLLNTKTNNFIAYNYDSLARIPFPLNFRKYFKKIYSFDLKDIENNNNFLLLTNFIYLDKKINKNPKNKAFMILSESEEREKILYKIAEIFNKKGIENYEFILVNPIIKNKIKNVLLTTKRFDLKTIEEKMNNAEILIDLLRKDQTGLSFRVFEAMALHKKIITNNKTIKNYDFYNPNNILIIDENLTDIPDNFLNATYEDIPEEIYLKYTLPNFTKKIFN